MFTLNAAAQGFEPVYLGPDLPLTELAQAVGRSHPELVALSFVQKREPAELKALLDDIMRAVAGRCPVLVGGSGLLGQSELVRAAGALLMPESGRLGDLLPPPHAESATAAHRPVPGRCPRPTPSAGGRSAARQTAPPAPVRHLAG